MNKLSLNDFIIKAKLIHGDHYNYSKSVYINTRTKLIIKCNKCLQLFLQTPNNHLQNRGCCFCYGNKLKTNQEWLIAARKVHHELYDYIATEYINAHTKVLIKCNKCDKIFEQDPSHHLQGQGCPDCGRNNVSNGEKELVEFIKSFYSKDIITNDRSIIKPMELDIYLPDLKIGIEYNGEYWHKKREIENCGFHKRKAKKCKELNIKLINVAYRNWKNNPELIKIKIKKALV